MLQIPLRTGTPHLISSYPVTHNLVHGITLESLYKLAANVGIRDKRWVLVELCNILPGQVARRMLSPNQTRNIIEFAAKILDQNANSIVGSGLSVMEITKANQVVPLESKSIRIC